MRQNLSMPECASQSMSNLFYVQDSRSYVGNDMLFWGLNGNGYTTDLRKAQLYTQEQAQSMHNNRETDIPWPKEYIDAKTRPAVDMQYVKRTEALAGTGIVLAERKPRRKEQVRCQGCGSFISETNFWGGCCPRCQTDNRP
ncbi:hypothetical protein ACLO87_09590 [Paenalcaligenes sp. Me52]|uniref:hypothetical protein n=1 Tax=Paenalcaligenes sp. Me52 TaxID=3392038 RepID=UPI003D29D12E